MLYAIFFKNLGISVFKMWSLRPGPGSSEEALESAQYPVRQQCGKPLGCPAFRLLHGVLHHRGAGLLQHRRPIRTHERQGLPRHRHLHVKVRQPLRLIAPPDLTALYKLHRDGLFLQMRWVKIFTVCRSHSITVLWARSDFFFSTQFYFGPCPKVHTDSQNIVASILSDKVVFNDPTAFVIGVNCTQTTCKFFGVFGAKPKQIIACLICCFFYTQYKLRCLT